MKATTKRLALGGFALCTAWVAGLPAEAQEPKNPFAEAIRSEMPSIARADLLACSQLERAQITDPQPIEVDEVKKMLNGTWVRELTWYGVSVETESAYFFDFRRGEGSALMYDQSNLGHGLLASRLESIKRSPERMKKTPTLTFVDCDYAMIDRYYKISDGIVLDGVQGWSAGESLGSIWQLMNETGFFKRRFPRDTKMPEMLEPSVGGAYWPVVSLKELKVGDMQAVSLEMKGDYTFVHVGSDRVNFEGREVARFFQQDGKLIATLPAAGLKATGSNPGDLEDLLNAKAGWLTDCDQSFGLLPVNYERVVLQNGF